MKVKILEICFFDERRYYPGDVVELKEKELLVKDPTGPGMKKKVVSAEEQFSEKYMEKLAGSEVKKAMAQAQQVPVSQKRRGHFKEQVQGSVAGEKSSDDDVI